MDNRAFRWFEIPGPPFAWKRTGSSRPVTLPDGRKFSHRYQPKEQVDWKAWAKLNMKQCMGDAPPMDGPVCLRIMAVFPLSQGRYLKRSKRPRAWYLGAKDLSNVVKVIEDAANGILWGDDRQITALESYGIVGEQHESPRIEIEFGPAPDILSVPKTWRMESGYRIQAITGDKK